jgi:hypothetical protein
MMHISDDDPQWDRHDGGSGHDGPPWRPGDEEQARRYWDVLEGSKSREVLGYLIKYRGQQVHCSELVTHLRLDPDGTKQPANVVAGVLQPMHAANKEVGRCFPYCWWNKGDGAHYAMKQATAEIFDNALNSRQESHQD